MQSAVDEAYSICWLIVYAAATTVVGALSSGYIPISIVVLLGGGFGCGGYIAARHIDRHRDECKERDKQLLLQEQAQNTHRKYVKTCIDDWISRAVHSKYQRNVEILEIYPRHEIDEITIAGICAYHPGGVETSYRGFFAIIQSRESSTGVRPLVLDAIFVDPGLAVMRKGAFANPNRKEVGILNVVRMHYQDSVIDPHPVL